MGILSWILLGLVVGVLAKWIMPGDDPGGTIITILLGIAGAFVGGFLATLIGLGTVDGFNVGSLLIAIDDFERADAASASFIAALAQRAEEAHLLLLVTVDGDAAPSDAVRAYRALAQVIALAPLSLPDARSMLASVFGDVPNLGPLAARRGRMEAMEHRGARFVLRYTVPSRRLFGYRGEFLTQTRGEGVLHRTVKGYEPWTGEMEARADYPEIARFAHWLRGSAGSMGYDDFTAPAIALEAAAKSGKMEQVARVLAEVRQMAQRVVAPDETSAAA